MLMRPPQWLWLAYNQSCPVWPRRDALGHHNQPRLRLRFHADPMKNAPMLLRAPGHLFRLCCPSATGERTRGCAKTRAQAQRQRRGLPRADKDQTKNARLPGRNGRYLAIGRAQQRPGHDGSPGLGPLGQPPGAGTVVGQPPDDAGKKTKRSGEDGAHRKAA
jgi:hypothetical protein